jgi:shikimate kinase
MNTPQRIWLIGLMGSGKTSVGRATARRLEWAFIDTDDVVEAVNGMSVQEIFLRRGEEAFRLLEAEAIRLVASRGQAVIATGGGAVLKTENRDRMRKSGFVIYLQAAPDSLAKRLQRSSQKDKRPLLKDGDAPQRLAELLATREQAYLESAHATVDALRTTTAVRESVLNAAGLASRQESR